MDGAGGLIGTRFSPRPVHRTSVVVDAFQFVYISGKGLRSDDVDMGSSLSCLGVPYPDGNVLKEDLIKSNCLWRRT